MMSRLSIVVLVLLLAAGCSSHEEMKELQQRCNSGDQDACAQLNPVPVLPRPGPGWISLTTISLVHLFRYLTSEIQH